VTGAMISRSIRYAIERHQLLLEIERAKRDELAMKDQFLSNVSHELRGPLTSVHLFAANLHDGLAGPVTEPQRECLEVILRNTSRLKTRIDDLLEATRLQAGKVSFNVQAWPIGTLIEQAVTEMRAQAPQLSWRRELDGGLPDVHADRARIDQVLKNLLDNAEKFTAPGGSVVVRAFAADSPGMVGVEVADSGCGIPSHAQAHVFDRLYQHGSTDDQRSAGLGLGLYICREIVERHGGRLSVRSEVGVGSRFLFTIPAGPESARTRSGTE
jgi:signal transduction histidine kinase